MQGGEQGGPPLVSGADPERWAWFRGVDYASGWRSAKRAADKVNVRLRALDVWPKELRAVADTDPDGNGQVRLHGTVSGGEKLAEILKAAQRTKNGA